MTLWVARHAPVDASGICYGQHDVPARVAAPAAAEVVLARLDALGARVAAVWTSPWSRTRDLATALARSLGAPLRIDARLSELAFGEWEGRAYAELERTDAARFRAWTEQWRTSAPPGGERVDDLVARVAAWRASLEEDALAITHAGVVRALRALARGVDYAAVLGEDVEHLAVERCSGACSNGACT